MPGPGVLNTTGALSTAYACNSPVLCITGQIQSDLIGVGRGVLHEIEDQLEMLRHVTKWNARAMTPNEVPLRRARGVPPAPQRPPAPGRDRDPAGRPPARRPTSSCASRCRPTSRPAIRPCSSRPPTLLGKAERPLIIAGGGVLAAEAWDELRALAELLDAPVVMTVNGRGSLSDRHPLATIQLGLPDLLPTADVVLAVGTRLLGSGNAPLGAGAGAPLIRIDADPDAARAAPAGDRRHRGDAKLALAAAGRADRPPQPRAHVPPRRARGDQARR